MHAIAYDEIHDEIVVPQPFSAAILTFRGGANGQEAPIRVIQGPLTQLYNYVDQLAIDPVHNEIYVADGYPEKDHVKVFGREANGNVAPIRVLQGPDAFHGVSSVSVDPVHDLLLVSGQTAAGVPGVMIFDRTAQGNAKPRGVISGPKTDFGGSGSGRIHVYPPRGLFIKVIQPKGSSSSEPGGAKEFIGVWSIDDRGDVPPRWMIGGPKDGIHEWIFDATLDPKHKSVIISDGRLNAVATYFFPEIF